MDGEEMKRTNFSGTFVAVVIITIVIAIFSILVYLGDPNNPWSYFGFIAVVILAVLGMSILISRTSWGMPQIEAILAEDAKSVCLTNTGNAVALKLHATLVPLDREFEIGVLEPDRDHIIRLESMITRVKVIVNFQNEEGAGFQKTFLLHALGSTYDDTTEEDVFKPSIPLFGWK
jgi:hypothetical protein